MTPRKLVLNRGDLDTDVVKTLEKFAKANNTRVRVVKLDNSAYPVNNDPDILTIVFFGYPNVDNFSGGAARYVSDFYDGYLSEGQATGIAPSLIGETIGTRNHTYAEVLGNTIYILFDLLYEDDWRAEEKLEVLLKEYLKLPPFAVRLRLVRDKMARLRKESFENFKRIFLYKRSLKTTIEIKQQYDYINSISKSQVIVDDNEIRVNLGIVRTLDTNTNTKRSVGQHFFVMDTDKNEVSVFQLAPGSHRHPYFGNAEGSVCFGTIDEGLSNFIENCEYAHAARGVKIFASEAELYSND